MSGLKLRLTLDDELLPVQAFFNALPDDSFLRLLNGMLEGVGLDYNGVGCVLPGDDLDTAPQTGATFYIPGEECHLSNCELLKYIKKAIGVYAFDNPEHMGDCNALIAQATKSFSQ